MDYGGYYSTIAHHPLTVSNHHHGSPHLQPQQASPNLPMLHSPMPSQNMRQVMTPSPHQHQMLQMQSQQPQTMGHHQQQQQMTSQHQHQSYHQIQQPHSHGPPVSHSGSPHPQQQMYNNHQQSTVTESLPQQSAISPHHLHSQSPHHHGGPPMHMQHQQQQQQQQPQSLSHQIVRPQPGPPPHLGHQQSNLQQPMHHQQNSFSSTSILQPNMHHSYTQPTHHHHHPHQQPQSQPQAQSQHHNHHHHQHHQRQQPPPPQMMQHSPPIQSHQTSKPQPPPSRSSSSSFYPTNLSQVELRLIELNKRLQCRPLTRLPSNPLPNVPDEARIWWERFVSEFFEDNATLTLRTHEDKPVEYTIGRTLIPKFFKTYFDGGVTDLSINLRNPKEAFINPQTITLDCDQAFIITNNIFRHPAIGPNQGVVVHTEGHLILDFVSNSFDTYSIKSWRFYTRFCREYIDRTILATMGMSNNYLAEPVTTSGLTKSTISFLKMCMVLKPMQDLMFQQKQNNLDPKACLQKLLFDRYKFKSGEDARVATNKRRKRKPSGAPGNVTGGPATTNKKSKANVNNSMGNNGGLINNNNNNNMLMSQSGPGPGFSLASQDVMVVGEPSMMGRDFSDDNERMITRLENTKYDPAASTPSNADESDSLNAPTVNDNNASNSNNNNISLDTGLENHIMSPKLVQQGESQQIPEHHNSPPQQSQPKFQHVQTSPSMLDQPELPQTKEQDLNQETGSDNGQSNETSSVSQQNQQSKEEQQNHKKDLDEHQPYPHQNPQIEVPNSTEDDNQISQMPTSGQTIKKENLQVSNERPIEDEHMEHQATNDDDNQQQQKQQQQQQVLDQHHGDMKEETKVNSVGSDVVCGDSGTTKAVNLVEQATTTNTTTTTSTSTKNHRRRSSERKETLREGLMRTSDFVVAMKDLKAEHPALWRITTGNNLLQQFEPKTLNGTVLYENTNQYAGWNPDIKRDYIGVDVRLTQHTRNQITVERLLLNFQKLDDVETFCDKHFVIYLQILISTAIDPRFWEGIENDPPCHDYFITSRKIIDDTTKRYKLKLSNKLKLNEITMKNIEKYPNLSIKPFEANSGASQCQNCNTEVGTQSITFGDRSYDLHSFKPVKVTSGTIKADDEQQQTNLCDPCLQLAKLYSEVHHMGWKFYTLASKKVEKLLLAGKPISSVVDECLKDEDWLAKIYAERDSLWSRVDQCESRQ